MISSISVIPLEKFCVVFFLARETVTKTNKQVAYMSRGTRDIRNILDNSRGANAKTDHGSADGSVPVRCRPLSSTRNRIRPSRPHSVPQSTTIFSTTSTVSDLERQRGSKPENYTLFQNLGTEFHTARERKLMQLSQDDQEMIRQLKHKIAQQQAELNSRHSNIGCIQRNFETLNGLFVAEKARRQDLEEQLAQLKCELDARITLQAQYNKLHEEHCDMLQKMYGCDVCGTTALLWCKWFNDTLMSHNFDL